MNKGGVSERRVVSGLGARIREAREAWGGYGTNGKTRFAQATGISYTVLLEYESGKKQPGAWPLLRISEVSGVTADYLLRGTNKPAARSPAEHLKGLIRLLTNAPTVQELPEDLRRRYRDRVFYIARQFRRLLYDAQEFLEQARRHAGDLQFKADEFRQDWLVDQKDDDE